jgi:ribonuclease Z
LKVASTILPFPLQFYALSEEGIILDQPKLRIDCFQTIHRIPCWGFLITEKKKPRKIIREKVLEYGITAVFYENLKMGEDYRTKSGELIANDLVTYANQPNRSFAYCADTLYTESFLEKIQGATMVYHETTYLKDLEERAFSRFHSTTAQAAKIATMTMTKKLLIGHFSSKYEKLDQFLAEGREGFPNTDLAIEGVTYLIPH